MTVFARIADRLRCEERGFVVVLAVALLASMGTLAALVLTTGVHTEFTTARGRSWVQAIHVAEAGVENAIARLDADDAFSGSLSGTAAEGTYSVTVTRLARGRIQIDASGTAGSGAGLTATRKLRVTMAPPAEMSFALLSLTSIDTKNNDHVIGDIWANENVIVDDGDLIEGNVTAANGYVKLKQNSRVTKNVVSSDYNPDDSNRAVHLENGARIDGDATAATTLDACPGTPAGAFDVQLAASTSTIGGALKTCGVKTGTGPTPASYSPNTRTAAPGAKAMPSFSYDPDNYSNETEYVGATAVSDFQAALGTNVSGTYYINQTGTVNQNVRINLTNKTITGDLTIVSNTPIFSNGNTANTNDAIIVLYSSYQPPAGSSCDVNLDSSECSIHIKNNFDLNDDGICDPAVDPAVLLFSPYGPTAIKNNETQCGSIYAQNIQIKNNQTLAYDSRIDRMVGFGLYTYGVLSWVELAP